MSSLWIALTAMVALVVCGMVVPLVRRGDGGHRDTTLAVLKSQLAEIEAQLGRGLLSQEEARGLSTEIKRRILADGRERETSIRRIDKRWASVIAGGIALFVAVASSLLYASVGRPDLATATHLAASTENAGPSSTQSQIRVLSGLIEKLKAKLAQSPNEAQGWRLLGWAYLETGRPSDAVNAYARVVALSPRTAVDRSAQGDALVQAAGGQITPAALAAFHAAIALDPNEPRSRYFLALFKEQQGDHAGAMSDWIALLNAAPPDAPWLSQVRDYVERVARQHGEDISAKLMPPRNSAGQQAMIQAMVDKLATELKVSPRNEEGWTRLMRARMVLGDPAAATSAYRDARRAFADAPREQARLRDAARALGVPGS